MGQRAALRQHYNLGGALMKDGPAAWQPIVTAPHTLDWVQGWCPDRPSDPVVRMHWASDLSGEDQPAFQGWFYTKPAIASLGFAVGFYECHPTHWRPFSPATRA